MTTFPVYSNDLQFSSGLARRPEDLSRRGLQVYTVSQLIGVTGRTKSGVMVSGEVEQPLYGLSIFDRIDIAQKCDAVFGLITGRMNRIAGLEWSVVRESKEEDRIELKLKQCKQIFDEYANTTEIRYRIIRARMIREVLRHLPDCLPDLSNFSQALFRWKKRIETMNDDATTEIEDWLHKPNAHDTFDDFIKKRIDSDLVHGSSAIYKECVDGRLENLYVLPGGSVIPLKTKFVSSLRMFAQVVPGEDSKIYFPDEVVYSTYMPTAGISYGYIPLEALVNKVAETLFFDQHAAETADGTKPPEKIAVFGGEKNPFGGLSDNENMEIPLTREEESRIELLLNEPRKGALRVLTGYGTPAILDLSKSEVFAAQSERQRFIRESVAFVYNATNMEVNLTGSADTSGRSTSEAQADIEREKGIWPLVRDLENDINFEILPLRFGSGYLFQYKSGLSDKEQAALDQARMATGTYSVNELRVKRGDEPSGPEYDKIGQGQAQEPNGSEASPFNMRQM